MIFLNRVLSASIISIISIYTVNGQITVKHPVIVHDIRSTFKNQGKQEDYWAKELFKTRYKKQSFPRFTGMINILNETTFIYGNETLIVENTSTELKTIFKLGLFYPEIITGVVKQDTTVALIEMTPEQKKMHKLIGSSCFKVSSLEELTFLNRTPYIKRFRFLLFRKGLSNPTMCYIELTNEKAVSSTGELSFIEGSKLTFFTRGSVML
jgi:hypothetical protein